MSPVPSAVQARRLFGNAAIYALGTLGLQALSALFAPLLTLFLAPREFGGWSLALTIQAGLVHVYGLALHGAITRYYFRDEHDPVARRRLQGTVVALMLAWSLGLSLLFTLLGPWVFPRLFAELPFWPHGWFAIWMAFLYTLTVVPKTIWAAAEQPQAFVAVDMAASAVSLLGSLGLVALTSLGVLGLFLGRTLALVMVSVPCVLYLVRQVGWAWHWPSLWRSLRFSLPLVPHLLALWVLAMFDRIVLDRYLGMAAVGIYAAAYTFTEYVNLVAVSMNRAWVPQFTRAYAVQAERPMVARSITYFLTTLTAVTVALFVLGPTLVRLFFAARYHRAAELTPILTLAGWLQGAYYVYVAGLFFQEKNGLVPVVTVVAGASNLLLNLIFIPRYGLMGAAAATLVGYLVLVLGVRWACRRVTRLPFETSRLLRLALVAVPVLVTAWLLDARLVPWVELPAKLALLVAGIAALRASGFFVAEDYARMESAFGRAVRAVRSAGRVGSPSA